MPSRRSRTRRVVRRAVVLLAALGLVVAGGVIVLNHVNDAPPIVQRCIASDDDRSAALDPEQSGNAALIAAITLERELPARALTIALATVMQESRARNLDYGDRDSLGMFQQRPSQGWGSEEQVQDPHYATHAFYDALVRVDGYQDMEITVAAQEVQRSGFPDAYAQHETLARLFASSLTGYTSGGVICRLAPASPVEQAELVEALPARLALDLPSLTASQEDHDGGPHLLIDVTALAGEPERLGWAVASWAVMTAQVTGASEVSVAGQRWVRDDGADAAWEPVPEGHPAVRDPVGIVRIS
ncbi:hypothetical protein IM660_14390 [Ruania alkalisoli]|uniref:Heavy metal transporter n=1 Tax=Ruania alkalisoli TaxID=2779775 RepID=A0A7M1SS70_9MICO|nr:hypothetical protein [Ruania alkalisoli]QOR69834.1 hypothetical protein IM660_14390 [Ruania alkalisoli]